MTFSSVVAPGNIRSSSQRSSRNGVAIDHFILHHSAAFDVSQVLNEMVNATKQVSANYVVANDGTAYGVVDEEDRAWTSGSSSDGGRGAAWDRRSVTFEILDETGAPDWTISAAAQETVAQIIADCSLRYGIAPQRAGADTGWAVYGHRELYTIFAASYSTACPGGLPLSSVTARAAAILTPTIKVQQEDDMKIYEDGGPTGPAVNTGKFYAGAPGVWLPLDNLKFGGDASVRQILTSAFNAPVLMFSADLVETAALYKATAPAALLTDVQIAAIAAQVKIPAAAPVDLSGVLAAISALNTSDSAYLQQIEAILAKGLSGTVTVTPS